MLSRSENQVAELLKTGLTNKDIADKLCVTDKTVKFHLTNIYKKLNVKNRAELIARSNGYHQPTEAEVADWQPVNKVRQETKSVEPLPNQQGKNQMLVAQKSQEEKITFIDEKFKVGSTIQQLHHMMTEVTKQDINPSTVNAACNCVARLNETINTAIQAARFLNER